MLTVELPQLEFLRLPKNVAGRCDAMPPKETRLEMMVKAQLGRPKITVDEFTCSTVRRIVIRFTVQKSIHIWTRFLSDVKKK